MNVQTRAKILADLSKGHRQTDVAERHGVSQATVSRVKNLSAPRASHQSIATLEQLESIDASWALLRARYARQYPHLASSMTDAEFDDLVDFVVATEVARLKTAAHG